VQLAFKTEMEKLLLRVSEKTRVFCHKTIGTLISLEGTWL